MLHCLLHFFFSYCIKRLCVYVCIHTLRAVILDCFYHLHRLFGVKCGRCGEPLGARELVMRAGPSHVYHVGCFACVACMQPLQKGQQYVVKAGGGQLFCRTDFEKEIFLMQQTVGSPQPGERSNTAQFNIILH